VEDGPRKEKSSTAGELLCHKTWHGDGKENWAKLQPQNSQKNTSNTERLFDEEAAKQFPPSRIEDMKIPLHPDAPKTINCKIYPLNREEENYVREFLLKEEAKGYIYPGPSPITSPTFVREKKEDGEKRIIMDYREVNKHSV
jgi:hypothetical protein